MNLALKYVKAFDSIKDEVKYTSLLVNELTYNLSQVLNSGELTCVERIKDWINNYKQFDFICNDKDFIGIIKIF